MFPIEATTYRRVFGRDPISVAVATASYNIPFETFAIGIFVHRGNPITRLSLPQLKSIFGARAGVGGSAARVWGGLGLTGKWARRPIHLYGYETNMGLGFFFEQKALGGSHFWNGNLREYANQYAEGGALLANAGDLMIRDLAADPNGIAFCGIGHQTPQVKALALRAGEEGPYIEPAQATVANRTYPLTRTVYFFTHPSTEPAVSEFLRYILSREGQRDVARQDVYLPLTAEAALEELSKLHN